MPELIRLRRGTLTITIAHQDQRGRSGVLDKSDRRTLGIHLRIVIHRSAKVRDHPQINLVLTVITLEVGQPGARHGGGKAVAPRDCPHGHITAITPAGNAQTMLINRSFFQGLVHSGENVTKIAITEILHVGACECLTLAKAATRVWKKYKISDS